MTSTMRRLEYNATTGYWTTPALLGEDVTRHSGTLSVEILDGRVYDVYSGLELRPVGETTLAGWGWLDGSAVALGLYNDLADSPAVRRTIAVPVAAWQRIHDIATGRSGALAGH